MITEEMYYTPTIDQFVEGFEYQTKHTMGYSIMDFSKPEECTKPEMKDYWFDNIVPNLDKPTYLHTIIKEDGTTWTFMNEPWPDEDPLRTIKIMLENGNIRAKR